MADVSLPNGVRVRASAIGDREMNDPDRDFGLYCDRAWKPSWPAEIIDWPDFGLPDSPDVARLQITNAFDRACAGAMVEVGCLGGLGRTGTVLACFAVLCGLPAGDAVAWVRSDYDPWAIETVDQERWVAWFASRTTKGKPA